MTVVHWTVNTPRLVIPVLFAVLLTACGKDSASDAPPATDTAATTPDNGIGGVETVEVTTTGKGSSRDEAIRDAVLRAVEQVHGRAISMTNISAELGSVERTKDVSALGLGASKSERESVTIGGKQLMESTAGLVTSIRIQSEDEGRKGWEVTVVAAVAKFTPPGGNKPRVVVGNPRGTGGTRLDARSTGVIRERISGALAETGKLAVLDRSEDADLAAELDFAESGEAAATEALKRGQAQVADFIVQITVDNFGVRRSARRMRTTNKEIVSYSGSASAAYKLIHVATRQVMASGSARASRSSPESLSENVNSEAWKQEMLDEVVSKMADEIVASLTQTASASASGTGSR